jgi:histidinol-phosphate/aromatic aminotransferase/cobyric acid decarboxylase-like protein/N-acyl-L-homoserine lactone synthetase
MIASALETRESDAMTASAETGRARIRLRHATAADREAIYRLRHEVFARELRQYQQNDQGRLTDSLDAFNSYIVALQGEAMVGFVSITPPSGPSFSLDKYVSRTSLPFAIDDRTYEIRLLTVLPSARRSLLALALMYAAFRWIVAQGGTRIIAIGRKEIVSMHYRVGLKAVGIQVKAGAVNYEVVTGTTDDVHNALPGIRKLLDRIESDMSWEIGVAFDTPAVCYHGGQFFSAVGEEFDRLDRLTEVISADVLDAWFPPAPGVIEALRKNLPGILQTSPPTACDGMLRCIARVKGLRPENLLAGAGSSDLIFLALRHWLNPGSRVLILDPSYGEYVHLLEKVIRCQVDRLYLTREDGYQVEPGRLERELSKGYDMFVLVNPNSPTGQQIPRATLEDVLNRANPATRVWVDETYSEYAGPDESVERFASASPNVVVCKSMSKAYALSGLRVAYLCAAPHQLETLRSISPPWAVSLPAQIAAVKALEDPAYYAERYQETHLYRSELGRGLAALGWDVLPSRANFLLCHLPESGPDAAAVVSRCREKSLFLRPISSMTAQPHERSLRVAVKDRPTNERMLNILSEVLR